MFFAVERLVDGFGADTWDTWVDCIFETKEEANEYVEKIISERQELRGNCVVVPCKFGKPIEQFWG